MKVKMQKKPVALTGLILFFGIVSTSIFSGNISTIPVVAQPAATPIPGKEAWTQPAFLLFRATNPRVAVSPDGFTSYCAASGAWGVVVGAENRAWTAGNYIKVSGQGSEVDCVFDSAGTLHLVWDEDGVKYAKLYLDGTVSKARDLTAEIGISARTAAPSIAYSSRSDRVFITFSTVPDSPRGDDVRYFTESSDRGTQFTTGWEYDRDNGYRPATPRVAAEQLSGNPVIMYGKMDQNDAGSIYAIQRNDAGQWSSRYLVAAAPHSQFFINAYSPPQGGVYATWIQETEDFSKAALFSQLLAGGNWQTPVRVGIGGHYLGMSNLAVGTNGYVWVMWVDPDNGVQARFAVSTDGGQSFSKGQPAFIGKDLYSSRFGSFGMVAVPQNGRIRVIMEISQDNPLYIQDSTLVLTEIDQSTTNPPYPTPAPPANFTPSLTAVVTTTPVTGTGQDTFEPDNTVEQAVAKGQMLVANVPPQVHNLYDLRNPDRNRDVDVLVFQGQAGKSYLVEASGNGNKNFQLKGSFYYIGQYGTTTQPGFDTGTAGTQASGNSGRDRPFTSDIKNEVAQISKQSAAGQLDAVPGEGSWLGAANECNGDTRRLCFSIRAAKSGLYYAQFSNYLEGNGSPQDYYAVRLLEEDNPPTSPAPSPTVTNSIATETAMPVTTIPAVTTVTPTPETASPTPAILAETTAIPATPVVPTSTPVSTSPARGKGAESGQEPVTTQPVKMPVAEPTKTPSEKTQETVTKKAEPTSMATVKPILLPQYSITPNGGIGPVVAVSEPAPRPSPTPTMVPATATPTRNIASPTPVRSPGRVATPAGASRAGFSAWWLLPLGLVFLAKGGLNLISKRRLARAVKRV